MHGSNVDRRIADRLWVVEHGIGKHRTGTAHAFARIHRAEMMVVLFLNSREELPQHPDDSVHGLLGELLVQRCLPKVIFRQTAKGVEQSLGIARRIVVEHFYDLVLLLLLGKDIGEMRGKVVVNHIVADPGCEVTAELRFRFAIGVVQGTQDLIAFLRRVHADAHQCLVDIDEEIAQ